MAAFSAPADSLPPGHVVVLELDVNPYLTEQFPSATQQFATKVISIEHIADGAVSEITNLSTPFQITHQLQKTAEMQRWIDYALESPENKAEIIKEAPFTCSFYTRSTQII